MGFIDRFITLAKADAHGVLDSLEDETLVLRQCLREAEGELARNQARRDELVRWLEKLGGQREAAGARIQELDDEVRLAVESGEEELARFSIRRLLAAQRQKENLEDQTQTASEEARRLGERIAMQEAELGELRRQVEVHLARERALDSGCTSASVESESPHLVRDEEVELELLRRRRKSGGEPETRSAEEVSR